MKEEVLRDPFPYGSKVSFKITTFNNVSVEGVGMIVGCNIDYTFSSFIYAIEPIGFSDDYSIPNDDYGYKVIIIPEKFLTRIHEC